MSRICAASQFEKSADWGTAYFQRYFQTLYEHEGWLIYFSRQNFRNQDYSYAISKCLIFSIFKTNDLQCGVSMHDWVIEQNPSQFNIDERRLVQFGMHYKFLRKLSSHPVAYTASPDQKDINK